MIRSYFRMADYAFGSNPPYGLPNLVMGPDSGR
jgi:hypothetical protein